MLVVVGLVLLGDSIRFEVAVVNSGLRLGLAGSLEGARRERERNKVSSKIVMPLQEH